MFWLFGQIWLWSLISFLLGAALTALVFTRLNRARPEPEQFEDEPVFVESSRPGELYDQEEEPEYTDAEADMDMDTAERVLAWPVEQEEVPESGYRQGTLPSYPPPPAQRSSEPEPGPEPAWPRADELPSLERRPGHRR